MGICIMKQDFFETDYHYYLAKQLNEWEEEKRLQTFSRSACFVELILWPS